ncbi:Metallo-dependent hydrolase [Aureobasidium subglaciale]|nr:Metallo-dependent hydrolase [Aureobasidium subglaciale]
MEQTRVFIGSVIHSLSPQHLKIIDDALIIVRDGRIITLDKAEREQDVLQSLGAANYNVERLPQGDILIPGFVDTHNHAPQWMQRGLGQGMHILDWLDKITFPNEAKFEDSVYAQRVYASCVAAFLRQGITTASYYSSRHAPATKILADECLRQGQRALIGKCNMNRNAPDYYRDESVEVSVKETEDCIAHVQSIDPTGELIRYVVTPRFAITCDDELLARLGSIAKRDNLSIQTHFNEAEQEMKATAELFPAFDSEADLYEHFGLLNNRSIMAHCCFMSDYELDKFAALEVGVAHCPIANMTVGGGFMTAPIRAFLDKGIKVGLGTDSGGGFSSSILDAIRQALIASNAREVATKGNDKGLSLEELFYMATLGGAKVCRFGDQVGNFEVGKEFDALWISGTAVGVMAPCESEDSTRTVFEKFLMTGDDRNIQKVYVRGVRVK